MQCSRLIIICSFLVCSFNIFGQIDCGDIDESALIAYGDSVRPIRIEILKIKNEPSQIYDSINIFNKYEKLVLERRFLTDSERQSFDDKLWTGAVIGDTVFRNDCYRPDYIVKVHYKDGYSGFVGIDTKCKSLENYKTRYTTLEFSGMLYLEIIGLIKKYSIE